MIEWIIQAETIGNISDGYWYSNGEEIVRCKDCKHHHKITCAFLIANCMKTSDDEDYCSRGERKDDEEQV